MKNLLLICSLITVFANGLYAQIDIGSSPGFPQNAPANCPSLGGVNFHDDGGAGSDYSANFDDTIVLCPDLTTGNTMTISFATNAGFTFNVDGSDTIYVFDGPTTTSPLIGAFNSVTNPNGMNVSSSLANNTGCLTVVFHSDGAIQASGWDAAIGCGYQVQPIDMHMEAFVNGSSTNALNPADTGFVNVCLGDSILFVAKPQFPYSLETLGYGYSQNLNNVDYDWNISGGGSYPNNDSIWFVPPTRNGFVVNLKITDQFPSSSVLKSLVRVSQLPIFAGTGPLEDSICSGAIDILLGGVNATDTVGFDFPEGQFVVGGSYAGLTYLPDGSGQEYETTINISGFDDTATIQNAQDLNFVNLVLEHSYAGDLEIWLECPPIAPATNGAIVGLLNSYNPGALAGGLSGGGTFFGQPYDDISGGGAGIGWNYQFSSVFNTFGPITSSWGTVTVPVAADPTHVPPLSAGTSVDTADIYAPETSFGTALAGCPLNGPWTIHVRDNLGTDDGYIFEWGLIFDPSFYPDLNGFSNYAVDSYWTNDPTITAQNDTSISVMPLTPGPHFYTFNVIDDYGCHYDTIVRVTVVPTPVIFPDTIACDFGFQVSGTQSFQGGTWSATPAGLNFSSTTANNPTITATNAGLYTVRFIDAACDDTVFTTIDFPAYPQIFPDTTLCSLSLQVVNTQAYATGGFWTSPNSEISFSPSNGTLNPVINSNQSGFFSVTFTDSVCNNSTSAQVTMFEPPRIFDDTLACFNFFQTFDNFAVSGGTWYAFDTAMHISSVTSVNPSFTVSQAGTYTVSFVDNQCQDSLTTTIFYPGFPWTPISDTTVCSGVSFLLAAAIDTATNQSVWNTGATGTGIIVNSPGIYSIASSNECYTYTDSAVVTMYTCDISAPNIIVRSSTAGNNKFILTFDGIASFNCQIFNRWGNQIYEFADVNGAWDGRDQDGTELPPGVYFYIFEAVTLGGEEINKQGFVELFD